MVEFTPLSEAEINAIVTRKAQTVIDEETIISRDTKTKMQNGAYFDCESLLSFEIVISDEYIYDWPQIRKFPDRNAVKPIETAKLKGLQKLYGLTWERVKELAENTNL